MRSENVLCLSGTQNALFVASMCLAGPGDEVITFDPLYPTYTATIEVSGARLVRAPTGPGLRPDVGALESLITPRTRAIFWATPNNPSGVILSEAELAAIGTLARRHDLWIVSDEVYAGLAPGGKVPETRGDSAGPGHHNRQPLQVALHAGISRRLARWAARAGCPCRIVIDVHAVRSSGLHPGSRSRGALDRAGNGAPRSRVTSMCGASGSSPG